jgi:glyoxylase-like metal-dependent hydrolase (beta-lactamase superfamily II)
MASFDVIHFFDPATSTLSYLVVDRSSLDAVVIDPVLDFDPASGRTSIESVTKIASMIRAQELKLHAVLETHAHADHLSGSQYLKRVFGAKIMVGEGIKEVQQSFKPLLGMPTDFATDGSQFDRLLRDGERFAVGTLDFRVMATPGHTPACVSYQIGDVVFTGDALFLEDSGTGRCDFPKGSAAALYHSVHDKLYALPNDTRVFVGHDYQPGGRALAFQTTIGRAKESNIQLRAATSLPEYLQFRTERDRTLGAPRLLFPSVQVNIDAGRLPKPDALGRRLLCTPLNMGVTTLDDGTPA